MVQGELLFSMAHGIDFFFSYPWTSNLRFFALPHATASLINDIPLSMSNMFLSELLEFFFKFNSSTISKKLRYAASCVCVRYTDKENI